MAVHVAVGRAQGDTERAGSTAYIRDISFVLLSGMVPVQGSWLWPELCTTRNMIFFHANTLQARSSHAPLESTNTPTFVYMLASVLHPLRVH